MVAGTRSHTLAAEDIEALRGRAAGGDAVALTRLGQRLLVGEGVAASPSEAITCLREAAERGGGEATANLALFAAWGVLRARDFNEALDLLQSAAGLGHSPSQVELRLLAGGDGADWAQLRRRIDVGAWTRAKTARVVSAAPQISVIEGFAGAAECDWLIARGRGGLQRALVYRRDAAGHAETANRTNSESAFTVFNASIVLALLRERIAATTGVETAHLEVAKLLHYEPGQQFGLHADFIETATPALAEDVRLHGQRVKTFLVYLNADYEGGETEFPRIGFRYKGRKGDALCFSNVDEQGRPDHRATHAGLPPTAGTKWLLSQWVRSKPCA